MTKTAGIVGAIKALANDRRLLILSWLKDPRANFRPQVDGDLVDDGVCAVLIAEKLGVSQPTLRTSKHKAIGETGGSTRVRKPFPSIMHSWMNHSPHRESPARP